MAKKAMIEREKKARTPCKKVRDEAGRIKKDCKG